MDDDPILSAARERVGRVLSGKWRLDRLIGVGGMAAVYEASHYNGKRVAVKMLHAAFCAWPEAKARFLQEAYAANAVRHAGVVSVLDDGETEAGEVFLLMDLLEGETLEALWRAAGQRLALEQVLPVADALLDALGAAHAAGVVHRDVKPDNVFVTTRGAVRLLDFGIAHVRQTAEDGRRTQAGTTMGTPEFMAPEQARGRWSEVDARSDVFSVGAVIFAMLAGRCVHEGGTVNEVLLSAMTRRAPRLAEVCPGAPPAVAAVVDRALAFERDERFPDARAMLAALRMAASDGVAPRPSVSARVVGHAPSDAPSLRPHRSSSGPTVADVHGDSAAVLPLRFGGVRSRVPLGIVAVLLCLLAFASVVALVPAPRHAPPAAVAAGATTPPRPALPQPSADAVAAVVAGGAPGDALVAPDLPPPPPALPVSVHVLAAETRLRAAPVVRGSAPVPAPSVSVISARHGFLDPLAARR